MALSDEERARGHAPHHAEAFEERGGAWKIAKRICTMDCSRDPFPNEPSAISKDFPKVGPKGVDPLYALFAEA